MSNIIDDALLLGGNADDHTFSPSQTNVTHKIIDSNFSNFDVETLNVSHVNRLTVNYFGHSSNTLIGVGIICAIVGYLTCFVVSK